MAVLLVSREPWWVEFLDWHVRTEHPWDVRLHMDAMSMAVDGFGREIGEALAPAIERAATSLQEFLAAYSR